MEKIEEQIQSDLVSLPGEMMAKGDRWLKENTDSVEDGQAHHRS
jgi:hypothetical protein